jgi:hypothetical protein
MQIHYDTFTYNTGLSELLQEFAADFADEREMGDR